MQQKLSNNIFLIQLSHSIMYRNTHHEIHPTLHFAVPTIGIHQLICHTMPPNAQPRAKTNTKVFEHLG